jgi:mRNA-degrading endonuclease toxin of MazEF toxin-antitoxin module
VKVTQIRTLSTERLGSRLSRLDDAHMQRITNGLQQIIG